MTRLLRRIGGSVVVLAIFFGTSESDVLGLTITASAGVIALAFLEGRPH